MGFFTSSIAFLSFSSASVYSVLRHYQLRRGPFKMDWSGLVFAYRGRNFRTHEEKVKEFTSLLEKQKEKLKKQLKKNKTKKNATTTAASASSAATTATQSTTSNEIKPDENDNNNQNQLVSTTTTNSSSSSSSAIITEQDFSDPAYSPYDFSLTLPKVVSPNSLAALEYAQINHASGVHVDCRVCKSGELVLFADEFCFPTLKPVVELNLVKGKSKKEKEEKRTMIMDEFKKKRVSDCQLWELKEMAFAEEDEFRTQEEKVLNPKNNNKKKKMSKTSKKTKKNKSTSSSLNETEENTGEEIDNDNNEVFENWKKNRIVTAEECIKFCFENSLKLVMEVHVDSTVWGLPHKNIGAKQSRTKMIQSILQFYSSNPLPIEDNDFGSTSLRRQRQIRKWFETETMIVSDDPWLIYKVRDINWQIPAGIQVRKNWLEKRIYDRVNGYDLKLLDSQLSGTGNTGKTGNTTEENENENENNNELFVDSRPFYARKIPQVVKIVDSIMMQANLRLAPWLTGCSAVSLPKEMFSPEEVEKWRKRDVLIYWQGFGDDPEKFTKEMRYEASGESLMNTPEQKKEDALVVKKMEEDPYAKWEFRTPELYKKKPLGGSCVVCDSGFIRFFPQSS